MRSVRLLPDRQQGPPKGGRHDVVTPRMWKPAACLLAVAASLSTACGASRPLPAIGTTLPSPAGCFVQVWEQPSFVGASDYINGPRRYATLRDMPGRRDWRNRIRSLKVGPTSVVTVWSQEHFRGGTLRAMKNVAHADLPEAWAGRIESMMVECDTGAN